MVLDIGFPATLLESEDLKVQMITKQIVQRNFPEREEDVHKGNCGSVGVIAGARGMTGAAALSCNSSFLTGAGYVKLVNKARILCMFDNALCGSGLRIDSHKPHFTH